MRSWRTTGAARGRLKRASGRRSDRRFSALVDRVDQGREALATAKAMRRGRGAPGKVEVVDVLFAGPPPYEAADAWSDEKVNAWAQASVAWLRARAPTAYIFGAYLHRDERSPHLHVLFVPITDDGRLSWNRIEKGFAADADAGLKGGAILRSAQLRPDSAWGVGRSGRASDTSPDFRGLTKQGGPQRELVQDECIAKRASEQRKDEKSHDAGPHLARLGMGQAQSGGLETAPGPSRVLSHHLPVPASVRGQPGVPPVGRQLRGDRCPHRL